MFSKTWTRNELEARAAADIAELPRYIRVDYHIYSRTCGCLG